MSAIKTTAELRDFSFVMRNLLKVGLPVETALTEASAMMPQYKAQLLAGAHQISSSGWTLSQALETVLPQTVMPAVVAGEQAGKVVEVLEQIWASAKTQIEIDQVTKKLRLPAILIGFGILVSLTFFIFLVPFMYGSMSQTLPANYDPGAIISGAIAVNAFVMANTEMVGISVLVTLMGVAFMFTRDSFKAAVVDMIIGIIIAIRPIGIPYAQLKFGIMAQYLNIVSLAGLDADKRIDLVMDILPLPLRKGLMAFRVEMLSKGLADASTGNPANNSDPRNDVVLWPTYIRLAFSQASEGPWDEPMREFGSVMVEDGKEKLQNHIARMTTMAQLVVGLLVILPVGLLYSTMGKIMSLSMQMM